jgi:hypothetical protein
MRDYSELIAGLLLPITCMAIDERGENAGPNAMRALSTALREYADKVEQTRDMLSCICTAHCQDCNRYWQVSLTVKVARETFERITPDNCPECYNRAQAKMYDTQRTGQYDPTGPRRSGWTVFKYVPHPLCSKGTGCIHFPQARNGKAWERGLGVPQEDTRKCYCNSDGAGPYRKV